VPGRPGRRVEVDRVAWDPWAVTTGGGRQDRTPVALERAASKVPEVTIAFWVIKALTTGMGESTSD
jgi:hypothetical protein